MKVLLTGDSIIARHEGLSQPRLNANLKQKVPGIELTNTAVSGINSGAFFARLSELVLTQDQHDALVILLGTNDLATHKQVPLAQFKQNMSLIASAVVCEYWPPKVILVSPPAVDEQKQHVRSNKVVAQYSQVVEAVAQEYHFHYVNLYQAMIERGNLASLCQGLKNDGLHFGQAGYELLADLLGQALQEI
ncbi:MULTISPECIES: SGNH/GDSL hydrolase family protein [Lactobacillus]|uniref:Esterase n=1 Tax=Lactobacillus xujianguonis TaxID=2495899 RepID=A0A437SX79_9LACO|nr:MULTISPECIES: SGNH/GDSL hydrolase family protein [Lactobacillus]RVU71531.1 esterase [Lactobacillus xujianguonis]RVU76718.1 esterase [Lactobacillus xujianguonis]